MAMSPAHALGEQIGFLLEETTIRFIQETVSTKGYYVDYRHERLARGNSKEVILKDAQGNNHKLDIVIERGGSERELGRPVAFIEVAWRSYVKHSKAKAQEISAAIRPLAAKYSTNVPFQGAVLAGKWTENARKQLESEGFSVLYIPYERIMGAYRRALGLKINWEEDTPEDKLAVLSKKLIGLDIAQRRKVMQAILKTEKQSFEAFAHGLMSVIQRRIASVSIIPLHGNEVIVESVVKAISFLQCYNEKSASRQSFIRYEIRILYTTNDSVVLNFGDKMDAIRVLNQFV